jgi:hypothetical protein
MNEEVMKDARIIILVLKNIHEGACELLAIWMVAQFCWKFIFFPTSKIKRKFTEILGQPNSPIC